MNRLEIRQLIVVRVDADAEEQASVAPVNDLVVTKLTRIMRVQQMRKFKHPTLTSTKLDWYF